jgi:hypothetical protein
MPIRLKALLLGLSLTLMSCIPPAAADDSKVWQVRKSSGDVWVATSGVQPASLTQQTALKPGDNIRTGRNGRVLLVRGEETILITPNSVVGIPLEKKDGLPTTIIQQAGSILLDVEERNVKHFEVETPYLAAVVKGTQFRVTVGQFGSNVEVLRGKVEVADFKSGQFALVLPGQSARVSSQGAGGLSLSGNGGLSPVQQGAPRASSVTRIPVPRAGLSAPGKPADGLRVQKLQGGVRSAMTGQAGDRKPSGEFRAGNSHALRITSTIGDVNLDFQKATKGLARAATASHAESGRSAGKTVWNSDELTPGNGASKTYNQGNGSGTGAANGANGNGNGNANGNGNGGQGNGNAFGLANAAAKSNNGKAKGKN